MDIKIKITDDDGIEYTPKIYGHWEETNVNDGNDNYDFICSHCKHTDIHSRQVKVPHCWFCGAFMDN